MRQFSFSQKNIFSKNITFLSQKAEGFGRPLIEGMAMKKPVIATDVGPAREILGEKAGLFIPVGEINPLIEAIEKLMNNPQVCYKMGEKGHELVQKKFSLNNQINKMKIYIDQLLNNNNYA